MSAKSTLSPHSTQQVAVASADGVDRHRRCVGTLPCDRHPGIRLRLRVARPSSVCADGGRRRPAETVNINGGAVRIVRSAADVCLV